MRPVWLLILVLIASFGCETQTQYRALRMPFPPETPVVNLDKGLRQKNWLGPKGEGSCVHASTVMMLRWQNKLELAEWWRKNYSDGEWTDQLRRRLRAAKISFAATEKANITLLDDAHRSRRGAIIWWKPSHCCFFCGWVVDANGREYAAIIDNNKPETFEFVERNQFHKLWAGYGGFALTTLFDPPSPPIWRSYEAVEGGLKW